MRGNAFSTEYLDAVNQRDEPPTANEADTAGPFSLVEQEGMVALFRAWESAATGAEPLARFRRRETALLFQAIWPALGRPLLFDLQGTEEAHGFGLKENGQAVGSLRHFNPEAVSGGHFASYLTRSPASMALILEACGPTAQRHIGQILSQRTFSG